MSGLGAQPSQPATSSSLHRPPQRLKMVNDFKTAEEVVSYYCARDAAGFIWAGMLDSERRAFTLWDKTPSQDSFFLANKYELSPAKRSATETLIEVKYQVMALSDGNGTRAAVGRSDYRVQFVLKQVGTQWKIVKPEPGFLAPVVLESYFNAQM